MAFVKDPMSDTGLAGAGATSVFSQSGVNQPTARPIQLTPANNQPTKGTPQALQQMAQQTQMPPLYTPGVNGPVVNQQTPTMNQMAVKGSPLTPQPAQPAQSGMFPVPKMARLGRDHSNSPVMHGEEPASRPTGLPKDPDGLLTRLFGVRPSGAPGSSKQAMLLSADDDYGVTPIWGKWTLQGDEALEDLVKNRLRTPAARSTAAYLRKEAAGPLDVDPRKLRQQDMAFLEQMLTQNHELARMPSTPPQILPSQQQNFQLPALSTQPTAHTTPSPNEDVGQYFLRELKARQGRQGLLQQMLRDPNRDFAVPSEVKQPGQALAPADLAKIKSMPVSRTPTTTQLPKPPEFDPAAAQATVDHLKKPRPSEIAGPQPSTAQPLPRTEKPAPLPTFNTSIELPAPSTSAPTAPAPAQPQAYGRFAHLIAQEQQNLNRMQSSGASPQALATKQRYLQQLQQSQGNTADDYRRMGHSEAAIARWEAVERRKHEQGADAYMAQRQPVAPSPPPMPENEAPPLAISRGPERPQPRSPGTLPPRISVNAPGIRTGYSSMAQQPGQAGATPAPAARPTLSKQPLPLSGNYGRLPTPIPKPPQPPVAPKMASLSPFAAAFLDGCRQRGFSSHRIQQAVKLASDLHPAIREELAGLEKQAIGMPNWGQMGGALKGGWNAVKGFFGSGAADDAARGAMGGMDEATRVWPQGMGAGRAAGGALDDATRSWPQGMQPGAVSRGATPLSPQGEGWFSRSVAAPALGGVGGYGTGSLINAGVNLMTGGEIPGLEYALGGLGAAARTPWARRGLSGMPTTGMGGAARNLASLASGGFSPAPSPGVNKVNRGMMGAGGALHAGHLAQTFNDQQYDVTRPRTALREFAADTSRQAIQDSTGVDPRILTEGVTGRVFQALNQGGPMAAIQAGWNELTPQQQTGLMMAIGGPLLGMGAAAMGAPGLGTAIGLGGLGLGGYQMYQGGGDPMNMTFQGANPQEQASLQQLVGAVPDFFQQMQHTPRSVQFDTMQEILRSLQQPAGSELARAGGGQPAMPAQHAMPAQ